jgi:hypothetical protein
MSKADGSVSFPSAELYAPFLYLYYTLCREDHDSFHVIFRSLLYAMCISATPPSIRPYSHGKYHLLSRLSTYDSYPLAPHACFHFLIHFLYYTLSYDFERCGCTLLAAWLPDSYGL